MLICPKVEMVGAEWALSRLKEGSPLDRTGRKDKLLASVTKAT